MKLAEKLMTLNAKPHPH